MEKIYYLFSIVLIFFSLQPVFAQAECTDLEITAVEDATLVCWGAVTLEAEGAGVNGTNIYWYESETSESVLGIGETFVTPELFQNTSYWAAEVFTESNSPGLDGPLPTYCIPDSGSSGCNLSDYIDDFILEDNLGNTLIEHVGTGCSPNAYADYTGDASLSASLIAGGVYDFTITHGTSSQYIRIWIDFDGNGSFEDADELVYTSTVAGSTTAPTKGSFEIPQDLITRNTVMRVRNTWNTGSANSCTQQSSYGEVHDYKVTITGSEVLCESPRKEVKVEVTTDPDEVVSSLPYSHSENTTTYFNNFSGGPGSDCGSNNNYLDGYDVVYKFIADADYLLTVSLENISEEYSAVFVYESCADIGSACAVEGSVAEDSTDAHGFEMLVEEGETYYFVVSSAYPTDFFDYTLNINGFGCNDIPVPAAVETAPYFMAGDFLSSLEQHIDFSQYNQEVKWYSDAGLTTEIPSPDTEVLVDGVSYYITQEIIGCESDALELTPREFDCSVLSPNVLTPTIELCVPGGVAVLKAEASAAGDKVYWYENETDIVAVHEGSVLDLGYIEESKSYWVTEKALSVSVPDVNQPLEVYCTPAPMGWGCQLGSYIDNFILEDNNSNKLIEHLGTGCSPNAYADYTDDASLVASLVSGETYNFTVTHGGDDYVRIWIDFDGNGSFEDADELVYVSTVKGSPGAPTVGSFVLPEDLISVNTAMRIRSSGGTASDQAYPCYQDSSFGEVHDYKVSITGNVVLCESDKIEVKVIVSDDIPEAPVVDRNYVFCGIATYTLADIEVAGDALIWYDRLGNELEETTEVEDGNTYYVVDASGSCISEIAEVYVSIRDISELPVGDTEQEFTENQTLADLKVTGRLLKWYADENKEIPLDEDTKLVDGTTYYVTQTKSGYCESDVLAIKVVMVLAVDDFHFDRFKYFPNPVENILTLSNGKEIQSVEVYDLLGRVILKQEKIHQNEVRINFENISTGNYMMKIFVDNNVKTIQIIKK